MNNNPISSKMKKLSSESISLIRKLGRSADIFGVNAFLVGGFVRDLMLGRESCDLDIVLEGDALGFAESLKKTIGGTVVEYPRFGTASLFKKVSGRDLRIDLTSAREEIYVKPASLPEVTFSSIEKDLRRRDFTINAMAIGINRSNFAELIDVFGGREDIKNRVIRVLHDKSFLDDPTRIFRAVRFEQRFAFKIEKHTEDLIKEAAYKKMFEMTSGERIHEEIVLILKEKHPEKIIRRMIELKELGFIHPNIRKDRGLCDKFRDARKGIKWYSENTGDTPNACVIYLMIVFDGLTGRNLEDVFRKIAFSRVEKDLLKAYNENADRVLRDLSSKEKMSPSLIYKKLSGFPDEVLLCIMSKSSSGPARRRIRKFLLDLKNTRLRVGGSDIKRAGLIPGPGYKRILDEVLFMKLDGKVLSKKDELLAVKRLIGK